MTVAAAVADPGIGREEDPIGSEGWAQRVRLRLQHLVNEVDTKPDSLHRMIELVKKHRAWTLMNTPDGGHFTTFDEFCEFRQPWGLGRKWETLKPYVEAVAGKQAVQLATVAPAQSPPGKKTPPSGDNSGHAREGYLRAILRAPVEVQELYRAGAISQKLAAKLGPKDPVRAPSREAVVDALRGVPRERKAVDAKVRELLGQKTPTLVERALALVARMTPAERRQFREKCFALGPTQ